MLLDIDWKALLLGEENWDFLIETVFRSLVMFLVILFGLRLLGKRGVTQLSVFELGVLVGLGSAAGDPMFYKDVGLLAGFTVFAVVIGLYRVVTFLINKSQRLEHLIEGKPVCVIREGQLLIENFEKEDVARNELFMQLRLHQVSHLGQIELGILETNGEVSIYFYDDKDVKPGLSILPEGMQGFASDDENASIYACACCGHTKEKSGNEPAACDCCNKNEWVRAISKKRVG